LVVAAAVCRFCSLVARAVVCPRSFCRGKGERETRRRRRRPGARSFSGLLSPPCFPHLCETEPSSSRDLSFSLSLSRERRSCRRRAERAVGRQRGHPRAPSPPFHRLVALSFFLTIPHAHARPTHALTRKTRAHSATHTVSLSWPFVRSLELLPPPRLSRCAPWRSVVVAGADGPLLRIDRTATDVPRGCARARRSRRATTLTRHITPCEGSKTQTRRHPSSLSRLERRPHKRPPAPPPTPTNSSP
jgi:hypothetical protein